MQGFADSLLQGGILTGLPTELGYALVVALFAFLVLNFIMLNAGIFSWAERRVWARIQSRVGPNRVGPQGFLQWLADGLKNIMKEGYIFHIIRTGEGSKLSIKIKRRKKSCKLAS